MGLFSVFKRNKKSESKAAPQTANAEAIKQDTPIKDTAKAMPEKAAAEPKKEAAKAPAAKAKAEDVKATTAKKADAAPAKKETAKSAPVKKEAEKAAPTKKEAQKTAPAKKEAENAEAKADETAEVSAPTPEKITGRFEIKKAKDGRYVFNLYASNHVIVATSQVYSSTQSALVGINSVIANAHKAPIEDQTQKAYQPYGYPKWEMYIDKGQQYRFRLYAANGSCICHSQGYTSKTNCKNGIDSIIRSSRNAEIDKSYLKKEEK